MSISRLMSIRHAAVLAAVALFSAATPHDRYAPNHWALIVGIGDYQNFGEEIGGDLPGAVNDARAFRDVAISRFGVPSSNVRMMLDDEATRANLESAITEWLPSVVGPRDLVWIFFAGHGSQVWDEDGDEEDGLEETICPTDVTRSSPEMDVTDDEVGLWLGAIPAAEVVVFWDKCHAESSTRSVTPFALPRALDRNPEEDLEQPRDLGLLREARASRGLGDRIASRPSEEWRGQRAPTIVELAASQADQVAVDVAWPGEGGAPAKFGGAFTTLFVRNLWQAPSDATLEEVFARTENDLRAQRFQQRPALSGESGVRTRSIASIASGDTGEPGAPESGTVPVVAVDGNAVTLGGGANAGVTVGSIYEVGGVHLVVTRVDTETIHATRASTELRGLEAVQRDSLAPGARARLVAFAYPPAELRVSLADLTADARAAMHSAFGDIESLRLIDDVGDFAHLIVRPAQNGFVVLGLDGFVRHHVPAANAAAAARLLRPVLQREVQANRLVELDNPAQPFQLDFDFGAQDNSFGIGDLVEFHVHSERGGYLTIVDLGTDGSITVLFPNALDANNRIEPGQAFVLPTPAMQMEFRATPPAGRGIVRAFLTEAPLGLTVDEGDPDLGRAVMAALSHAVGPAPVRDSRAMPVGTWATASIAYEVTQ